jgi:hypothetical protein
MFLLLSPESSRPLRRLSWTKKKARPPPPHPPAHRGAREKKLVWLDGPVSLTGKLRGGRCSDMLETHGRHVVMTLSVYCKSCDHNASVFCFIANVGSVPVTWKRQECSNMLQTRAHFVADTCTSWCDDYGFLSQMCSWYKCFSALLLTLDSMLNMCSEFSRWFAATKENLLYTPMFCW